jgi:hypothetical protein
MNELTLTPSQHDHQVLKLAEALRPLRGRRLESLLRAERTVLHDTHAPGALLEMSRDRRYRVAPDGSYRKVR